MDKSFDKSLNQLLDLLKALYAEHEQLLALLQRKRRAMSGSESGKVTELCRLENQRVQIIAELEKQRLESAARLTLMVDPGAAEPMSLLALAERIPEPQRGQLLVLREQLRQKMQEVRQTSLVVRSATEALVAHMHGLVRTIGSLMTGISTYDRHGAVSRHALAVNTVNLTA